MTFSNFGPVAPPAAVLALLGAAALAVALLAGAAMAGLAGRPAVGRRLAGASAALAVLYALLLFAIGAATPARVVPRGGEKFFCEIDCHVGYAVDGVREEAVAGVRKIVVRLRARFDATTISPRRGDGPLVPNPRAAALVDASGRRFAADADGLDALRRALRPGESYVADLVFLVPEGAALRGLSLVEPYFPTRLLLGHERAPFAGETTLALR